MRERGSLSRFMHIKNNRILMLSLKLFVFYTLSLPHTGILGHPLSLSLFTYIFIMCVCMCQSLITILSPFLPICCAHTRSSAFQCTHTHTLLLSRSQASLSLSLKTRPIFAIITIHRGLAASFGGGVRTATTTTTTRRSSPSGCRRPIRTNIEPIPWACCPSSLRFLQPGVVGGGGGDVV